jgi:hypothetical protein
VLSCPVSDYTSFTSSEYFEIKITATMTIQVELIDGTLCRVVPKGLNLLLNRELVKRFKRSSGWAVVGRDPIRYSEKVNGYNGMERRKAA